MQTLIPTIWWIAPVASFLALIFARVFYQKMMRSSEGTDKMQEIAEHVREGAMAYIRRQYGVVTVVFVVLLVILAALAYFGIQNPFVPQFGSRANMREPSCRTAGHRAHIYTRPASSSANSGADIGLLISRSFGSARSFECQPARSRHVTPRELPNQTRPLESS